MLSPQSAQRNVNAVFFVVKDTFSHFSSLQIGTAHSAESRIV